MPGAYDAEDLNRKFNQIAERMRGIEAQLAVLSDKAGVPYSPPSDGAPPEVVQLAQSGDQMGAIKRYRELTGAGFEEAREVVSGL
jgi:ribosomal protein L7/L12